MMEVLKFISQFTSVQDFFLYGKCYWFATILKERFGGELYYHDIDNHWCCMIDGNGYDASGQIELDGFRPWPGTFIEDDLHYDRLVRQCIEFIE